MHPTSIALIGAGSFGTAIAIHLARAGHVVRLYSHDTQHISEMTQARCNTRYLPDVLFPETLHLYHDLHACLAQADQLLIAVPSHAFASVLSQLPQQIPHLSWLTKGIDPNTHRLLSDLVRERFGDSLPIAVISGPSFAKEVAAGLPTALVIAGNDATHIRTLQTLFHYDKMRIYLSDDYVGVQWCGTIKNILAIACGVSDGLHFGANAKAALITRGLTEMQRLGRFFHADPDTFLGLAGLGDLVLTCTDNQSRNRRFGLLLGEGLTPNAAEKQIGQVVEGAHNAAQIAALAQRHQIDMPICQAVHALLTAQMTPAQAVLLLMNRPPLGKH